RQELEEGGELLRLVGEHRRELPQERAELVLEAQDPRGVEIGERLFYIAQPEQVRDIARALDGEHEPGRRVRIPLLVVFGPLQRVERAVDLQRGEMPAAEFELAPLRQPLR